MEKYMKDFNGEEIFCLEYDKATLVDMVTDLQELNYKLKNLYETDAENWKEQMYELQQRIDTSIAENMILIKENNKMQQKIYKAIEWVNNHIETYTQNGIGIIDWNYNSDPRKLLEILKGEFNEKKEKEKISKN